MKPLKSLKKPLRYKALFHIAAEALCMGFHDSMNAKAPERGLSRFFSARRVADYPKEKSTLIL